MTILLADPRVDRRRRHRRQRPRLWLADVAGARHLLGQKAGCCRAHRSEPEPGADPGVGGDDGHDERHPHLPRAVPPPTGRAGVCSTCCLREPDDVSARLVWDLKRDAQEQATAVR